MPRLQKFVECLGTALCEYATAALARLVPFETALLEVARSLHRATAKTFHPSELRASLREAVSSPPETVELAIPTASRPSARRCRKSSARPSSATSS